MESVLQQGEEGSPKRGKIVRRARQRRNGQEEERRKMRERNGTHHYLEGFLDVLERARDQIWPLRSAFDILPMTSFSGVNAALQSSCR